MANFTTAFNGLINKVENNFIWCKNKFTAIISDLNNKALNTDLSTHTGNTTVHITSDERTNWNAKQNALTAAQLTNIANVVNKADKTDIPTKVSQLANDSEYATKTEVNAIASARLRREVVAELPTVEDAIENTIYLVPNGGTDNNVKDEYLFIDGAFELLGSTEIDMSDYYSKTELDAELTDMFNSASLTELK